MTPQLILLPEDGVSGLPDSLVMRELADAIEESKKSQQPPEGATSRPPASTGSENASSSDYTGRHAKGDLQYAELNPSLSVFKAK